MIVKDSTANKIHNVSENRKIYEKDLDQMLQSQMRLNRPNPLKRPRRYTLKVRAQISSLIFFWSRLF